MSSFHQLVIESVQKPLPDVVSLSLSLPQEIRPRFDFVAGQHLSLRTELEGQKVQRNYSIHSCPSNWTTLNLSIRRIEGGRMSTHLFDTAKPGQTLEVRPPAGRFVAQTDPKARRTWFFFAAGTGITPIWSMIQAVLHQEPKSFVRLLYGNKRPDSILFAKQLQETSERFGARLVVEHTLSDASASSWWQSKPWTGMQGRVCPELIDVFFRKHPAPAQDCEYRICGPGAMNREVQAHLLSLGVEAARIGYEQFGAPRSGQEQAGELEALVESECELQLDAQNFKVRVPKGQTLLEAFKSAEIEAPHSCEAGICGSCSAVLLEGEVHMPHHPALDAGDLAAKQILVCQARAKAGLIKLRMST